MCSIEPAAGRLFDIYYEYTAKSDLTALQSLTEEAYKVHERLRKLPIKNRGFFDLDEFLLLKALRNHSVHKDDFMGKAYAVNRQFAESNKLDLLRICLIEKKTVKLAINAEPVLDSGEEEKVSNIKSQLVDFGDYYNIEPVIFNFMVKVYEKLSAMKLSIPGKGYSNMETSYKNEIYYNYPHYVPLVSITASNEEILANITPIENLNIHESKGLTPISEDPFNQVSTLDIDMSTYEVIEYKEDDYQMMHDAIFNKIIEDPNALNLACLLPKHIGLAFVHNDNSIKSSEITGFNIRKQKEIFELSDIVIDPIFYETNAYQQLVLLIVDHNIFPVIILKSELFKCNQVSVNKKKQTIKVSRNEPCVCGSGKKYKKCCI